MAGARLIEAELLQQAGMVRVGRGHTATLPRGDGAATKLRREDVDLIDQTRIRQVPGSIAAQLERRDPGQGLGLAGTTVPQGPVQVDLHAPRRGVLHKGPIVPTTLQLLCGRQLVDPIVC